MIMAVVMSAIGPVFVMMIVPVTMFVIMPMIATGAMHVLFGLRIDQHRSHCTLDGDRSFSRGIGRFDRKAHDF